MPRSYGLGFVGRIAAALANLLCVLPFVFAALLRAADLFVIDLRLAVLLRHPGGIGCVALMLIILGGAVWGRPLKAAGAAALLFAAMKQWADGGTDIPQFECFPSSGGTCTALVTGADSGLGFAISRALAQQGHTVVLSCRDYKRCQHAKQSLEDVLHVGTVHAVSGLDLTSLTKVSMFAFNLESLLQKGKSGKLDLVVLNSAGGPLALESQRTTEGFEMGFGTAYIANFALLRFLNVSALAAHSRMVLVSSEFMRFGSFHNSLFEHADGEGDLRGELTTGCGTSVPFCFPPRFRASDSIDRGSYPRSKLAEVLLARELARRGASVSAVHPGMVMRYVANRGGFFISLWDEFKQLVLRPPDVAAAVVLRALQWDRMNGGFVNAMGHMTDSHSLPLIATDNLTAARLWEVAEIHVNRWDEVSR